MATYKDLAGHEYTEEEWNARCEECGRRQAAKEAAEIEAYKAWMAELLEIATAEIPNFTAYNAQEHLDSGLYLDPCGWEGCGHEYQKMTPREYFNAVRAEIEKYMLDHPMKTPEQIAEETAKREAEWNQYLRENPKEAKMIKRAEARRAFSNGEISYREMQQQINANW